MKVSKIVQKHFLCTFWGFLVTIICDVKNWHQNVWTSLCQFIFFVNLLHSLCVWFFDIWHLFDNLTSFWHFDISFNLNHLSPSQGYFLGTAATLANHLLYCNIMSIQVQLHEGPTFCPPHVSGQECGAPSLPARVGSTHWLVPHFQKGSRSLGFR